MKKLKILLILCTCMSLQCFAFTFLKAGTVWSIDCDKGTYIRFFGKTSSGQLAFYLSDSPHFADRVSLISFKEEGDQITFVYEDLNTRNVFTMKGSLAEGVLSILYAQRNNEAPYIRNGLIFPSGEKFPPFDQCSKTSRAYKRVFPDSPPPEELKLDDAQWSWSTSFRTGICDEKCLPYKRKFPREYENYMNKLKKEKAEEQKWEARYERAQRECATAGDIDRCIRIKTG